MSTLLNDELAGIYDQMAGLTVRDKHAESREFAQAIEEIADAVKILAWHCDRLYRNLEAHEETKYGVHGK